MAHRKRERKSIEKKKKTPRVSSNKGEVNILSGEKHINLKKFYSYDFLPLHHTTSKTLS
jgi:hypothetical protein